MEEKLQQNEARVSYNFIKRFLNQKKERRGDLDARVLLIFRIFFLIHN